MRAARQVGSAGSAIHSRSPSCNQAVHQAQIRAEEARYEAALSHCQIIFVGSLRPGHCEAGRARCCPRLKKLPCASFLLLRACEEVKKRVGRMRDMAKVKFSRCSECPMGAARESDISDRQWIERRSRWLRGHAMAGKTNDAFKVHPLTLSYKHLLVAALLSDHSQSCRQPWQTSNIVQRTPGMCQDFSMLLVDQPRQARLHDRNLRVAKLIEVKKDLRRTHRTIRGQQGQLQGNCRLQEFKALRRLMKREALSFFSTF